MRPDKLARALLGAHQDHLLWRPAFVRFLDCVQASKNPGAWSRELQTVAPEAFIPRLRGHAQRIYSATSKVIHQEHLHSAAAVVDDSSLGDTIESGVKTAASLAVVANFCDHTAFSLAADEALTLYEGFQ